MQKSYQKELLDADSIPKEDLYRNLYELKVINTYLGGHEVVRAGLCHFKDFSQVVELGSGGGDNLNALQKISAPSTLFTGIDLKEDCTNYAKKHYPSIDFITADYRVFPTDKKPDVIFNSLFCHHFNEDALVEMLKFMYTNSTKGFFIADLHRHPLAYYSIRLLTSIFSKSYLVKNDAPLSVKRGFTRKEWESLLGKAGIKSFKIHWKWAFRHLIVVKKEA